MKITVVGSGYVGLVSGACLADVGNDVLCLDVFERFDDEVGQCFAVHAWFSQIFKCHSPW
jgi:phytoene dehydrogenase-like protein